jgi:tripartite-type tricarboxylate transporter receptor subunit TctC
MRAFILAILLALSDFTAVARADDVEAFYRGRPIDMIIGFSPGGGYDLYARLIAQFMGDHIPGRPRIVPRNMAGAGSRTAAAYIAAIAPRDGSVLGTASQSLPLEQALGSQQKFDVLKFIYIGNPVQENNAMVAWAASGVRAIEDVKSREVTVGSTGDDPSTHYPKVLNALLGTRFRIITGYPGGQDINLAMERGELDARGSSGAMEWKANRADWVRDRKVNIILQVGLMRAAFLPDTPLLLELAKNQQDRAVFSLLSASIAVGRQIFTTPDAPAERVAALRKAFDATMRDPAFIAAAARQNFDLSPVDGETMQRIVREIAQAPPSVTTQLRDILASAN